MAKRSLVEISIFASKTWFTSRLVAAASSKLLWYRNWGAEFVVGLDFWGSVGLELTGVLLMAGFSVTWTGSFGAELTTGLGVVDTLGGAGIVAGVHWQ